MSEIGLHNRFIMILMVKGISMLILANLLLLYVPITAIGLGALLDIAEACLFLDHKNLLVLVCAFVLLTLVLELAVRWLTPRHNEALL